MEGAQYDHTDRLARIERTLTEISLRDRRYLDLEMLVRIGLPTRLFHENNKS